MMNEDQLVSDDKQEDVLPYSFINHFLIERALEINCCIRDQVLFVLLMALMEKTGAHIKAWLSRFMTVDLDNIPHCHLIPKLTYEEAAELSYIGTGILHPRTVEPVKNAGIPTIRMHRAV